MNKGKITRYTAISLLIASLAGYGLRLYDSGIDHLREYCPLNEVLGIGHQINRVNRDYLPYGIGAYYQDGTTRQEYISPTAIQMEDGSSNYTGPADYALEGDVGVRTTYESPRIVITKGIPVFPEGSQPGDVVPVSSIGIMNPEDIYVIPVPTNSR